MEEKVKNTEVETAEVKAETKEVKDVEVENKVEKKTETKEVKKKKVSKADEGTVLIEGCTGFVKWFKNATGYGFIIPEVDVEGSKKDIFVHYTAIASDGYKTLKAGQKVSFDVVKSEKGLAAKNVKTL